MRTILIFLDKYIKNKKSNKIKNKLTKSDIGKNIIWIENKKDVKIFYGEIINITSNSVMIKNNNGIDIRFYYNLNKYIFVE